MKIHTPIVIVLLLWLLPAKAVESPRSTTNHPASRVVIVENEAATRQFLPQTKELPPMIERGLLRLTHTPNMRAAWQSLISSNDIVGIKVSSSPGKTVGTRPEVVDALIASMLKAGIVSDRIVIWDRRIGDLYVAGFNTVATRHHVRLAAAASSGWDEKVFYENAILGTPVWGDLEFEQKGENVGRKSYVSKLVSKELTKIISVTPLLNHNGAAITGHLYDLALSSVDNSVRFEASSERLESVVPEIYALPQISDRVIFCLTDGLLCQYQGQNDTLLHYATPLNQLWFSTDPVASDVLGINELETQRKRFSAPEQKLQTDLYKNAALLELGVNDLKKIVVERVR